MHLTVLSLNLKTLHCLSGSKPDFSVFVFIFSGSSAAWTSAKAVFVLLHTGLVLEITTLIYSLMQVTLFPPNCLIILIHKLPYARAKNMYSDNRVKLYCLVKRMLTRSINVVYNVISETCGLLERLMLQINVCLASLLSLLYWCTFILPTNVQKCESLQFAVFPQTAQTARLCTVSLVQCISQVIIHHRNRNKTQRISNSMLVNKIP